MKNIAFFRMSKSRFLYGTLVLFVGIFSQPASAQIPVTDGAHIAVSTENAITDGLSQVQAYAEYAETLKRWTDTYAHYQQQISSIMSLVNGFNIQLPQSDRLNPVADDWGVNEKCHTSAGLDVASLRAFISLNPNGDMAAQQRSLCAKIQTMRVKKYNETVFMINTTVPSIEQKYTDLLNNIFSVANTQGNQDQHKVDTAAIDAETQAKMKVFEERMRQYDSYINVLSQQQQLLAGMALSKRPSSTGAAIVGAVVTTAALQTALPSSGSD